MRDNDFVEDIGGVTSTPRAIRYVATTRTFAMAAVRLTHERAHALVRGFDHASGKLNENSAPSPALLLTRIRPPCASTMPLAIASPRPAPPFLVRPLQ